MSNIAKSCRLWLALTAVATLCAFAQSPKATTAYPSHLPYSFSNFAWWTDDDLRANLKKRIPGLQDEIAPSFVAESKIRNVLIALLKEKGITGEVFAEDPSPSSLTAQREPDMPAPSITFNLVTPEILVDKIVISNAPDDVTRRLREYLGSRAGREYSSGQDWIVRSTSKMEMGRAGYLEAEAEVSHDAPRREGDHYLVNLLVSVKSGPQYHIAEVSGDAGPLLQGRDLSQMFGARPGDLAAGEPFERLEGQLRALYWQYGYADVAIQAPPVFDRERALVSYHLQVTPGPLYRMRSVTIHSLSAEQENTVRALLNLKLGDVFNETAINMLYRKLPSESSLKGYSFSFSPKKDPPSAAVDLTLDFFKSGENTSVTIK